MSRYKFSTEMITWPGPHDLSDEELEVVRRKTEQGVWAGVEEVSRRRAEAGNGYPDLSGLRHTGVKVVEDAGYAATQEKALDADNAIVGHFFPQAWVREQAVDVDGDRRFDATEAVLRRDAETVKNLTDASFEADQIGIDAGVVGDHDGPFFVQVADAAHHFIERKLDLDDVSALTDEDLDRLRAEMNVEKPEASAPAPGA